MASARLMPIALTLMRSSFRPGAGTWVSTNSRTSGPPACANLIVRDMVVSVKSGWRYLLRDEAAKRKTEDVHLRETKGLNERRRVGRHLLDRGRHLAARA